ncbi:inositol-tetrakisphosphate 1-kinase [Lingula anatina]|uniref:Inositol-tetrakisphosphate 1-kinase n=1 Tax=Lingula anatina TaxID=7574 RepID=A0A1S3J8N1_LINAN|nr:inositol-tetrakisphosphate 1-kinase [Lingula anatina]|eukprot:XP_023930685.1 inositol-tetrakisphosphate 1-kinase [Lingula anatina]
MTKIKRIGYWFSEEKYHKLKWMDFEQYCSDCHDHSEMELVRVDLSRPLHEQGPFDAIVHKLNDLVLLADQGEQESIVQLNRFQEYMKNHPNILLLDPFQNARRLLNRYEVCKLITDSEICKGDSPIFIPEWAVVTSSDPVKCKKILEESNVTYPLVCKPLLAESHEMAIIFTEEGMKDVQPPYVAQSFINHSAILYKLYVVGDELFFVQRPSLKNFTPESATETDTIFFHTFDVSKENSSVFLNKMDPEDQKNDLIQPRESHLRKITDSIRATLGMDLLGIDVIIEDDTGRYAVIDVNAFPGYKGIPEFFKVLKDFILKKVTSLDVESNKLLGLENGLHGLDGMSACCAMNYQDLQAAVS